MALRPWMNERRQYMKDYEQTDWVPTRKVAVENNTGVETRESEIMVYAPHRYLP